MRGGVASSAQGVEQVRDLARHVAVAQATEQLGLRVVGADVHAHARGGALRELLAEEAQLDDRRRRVAAKYRSAAAPRDSRNGSWAARKAKFGEDAVGIRGG